MSDMLTGRGLMILLSVSRQGPRAFATIVSRQLKAALTPIETSTLYVAMDRLVRDGFLTADVLPPRKMVGGRRRRSYAITPAGQQAMNLALGAIDALRSGEVTR